jgi:DNA gyrase subunit A
MYTKGEKIIPVYIEDEMKSSYIDYAMSVIVGRALPDVRDGLKPVHRRILYSMKDLSLWHNKPYKKCARIVGDCLGRFHPHGDSAVYDALVRMVQDFSLRYPLVEGQGNFGSIDGDPAAAMRYTEARMQSITNEMLRDLEKDTVDFVPNFDNSLTEPAILPAAIPNLLINGSSGIAVGMATNIPSHNLGEVIDAVIRVIDEPEVSARDLMKIIKGPDFPTGGIICGRDGIKSAYTTGRGRIKLRAKAYIETFKNSRESIIVSELPYQVNKTTLIEQIAKLVQNKKVEGISDLRDESSKEGIRLVIDVKKGQPPQVILNQLYKHTQLETTFGVIMLALVNNQPRVLTLREIIDLFVEHRIDIITRRTKYELAKAEARAHILEGYKIALKHLDEVIKVIKKSKTPPIAKENLMKKFGLSAIQAQAILEMQLQRLTNLERDKVEKEYLALLKTIEQLKSILKNPKKILQLIKDELTEIKKKYSDDRRTDILAAIEELEVEDLIAKESMVITMSHAGYIKRIPVSSYRKQRRGGVGVMGSQLKEEDFVEHLFIASTHDYILFFTDKGKVYWLKVYEVPQSTRMAKGRAVVNLLQISKDENITSFIPVKEFSEDKYLVMATKGGIIKKTKLSAYSNPRKGGIIAITLKGNDSLIDCGVTDGKDEIIMAARMGKAIRFLESQVRDMGRSAAGVKGISLGKKDFCIGMVIAEKESDLLTVSQEGFVKRTSFDKYRLQSRGGRGVINIKVTKRNGEVVGIKTVTDQDELIVITSSSMVVRCAVKDIRSIGRNTQGVRLISLKDKDKVVAIAKIAPEEEAEEKEDKEKTAETKEADVNESKNKAESKAKSKNKGKAKNKGETKAKNKK